MFDAVVKRGRRKPLFVADPETTVRVEFGRSEVERMLPHRDPMLLVDGIDSIDLSQGALSGYREVRADDPVLAGHFPGDPVYPGVLLLESIGQLGICLQHVLSSKRTVVDETDQPRSLRLLKVHHGLFQGAVLPGERVTLLAKALEESDYVSTCAGQVLGADGQVKALAVFEVFMLDE